MSKYNPLLAFAEVTDEIHNVVMSTLVSTTNVGFDWGSATLITMNRDYDEDSDTEWGRIDTDDLYPAPLIVTSDSETEITELRLSSIQERLNGQLVFMTLNLKQILILLWKLKLS